MLPSMHHVQYAASLIEEVGALVVFLPPYSPDLMPIEKLFSKVKGFLRANDPYIQIASDSEIKAVIFAAFASITSSDCYQWLSSTLWNPLGSGPLSDRGFRSVFLEW